MPNSNIPIPQTPILYTVPCVTRNIDPAGVIHKGPTFQDYYQLRDIIATQHLESFANGFAENIAEYALGRPVGFTDAELIQQITGQAQQRGYSIREFIFALISSETFGQKKWCGHEPKNSTKWT